MSDDSNKNTDASADDIANKSAEVKKDFQGLLGSTKQFLSELLDIRQNTDQEATRAAILADIPFKGHTSWILICSIFIASIGLNANSTAVVIGAMLISPLMGPILGLGMSLAINDIDTMQRSLKNLAVMVVLSVLTAYLFFALFPLQTESSELLARTKPDIRDVLIAFFGGLALVIARAKKGTIASVIFGVAIATALMPPLCTVGWGLAMGNWDHVRGAFLLFGINTIFIALATFLVLKILRFPMVRYATSARRRLIARVVSIVAIAVMVPAGIIFWDVYKEFRFDSEAKNFITKNIKPYKFSKDGRFLENLTELNYNEGENPHIELLFMGNENIPDNVIEMWKAEKNSNDSYRHLKDVKLNIIQGSKNESADQLKYVNELYESQKEALLSKDESIIQLKTQLNNLLKSAERQIPFDDISKEALTNYENLSQLSFSNTIVTDFSKTDTIPVFEIKWKDESNKNDIEADSKKLQNWLKIRLKDTTLRFK